MDPTLKDSLDELVGSVVTRERADALIKLWEEHDQKARMLSSVGAMANGIVHEINTPVQYITDNVKFLNETFAEFIAALKVYGDLVNTLPPHVLTDADKALLDHAVNKDELAFLIDEVPQATDHALSGLSQVAKIVGAMKTFAHPGKAQKVRADLSDIIQTTATISRNEWKYKATLATSFDPDLALVPCYPSEIHQVLLNMIVNAVHAIEDMDRAEMGKIRIETLKRHDHAVIIVADDGCGMSADVTDHALDPYFTTKAAGRGTGQGLALARSIIEDKHGGKIYFTSCPSEGTTFEILLPLSAEVSR